MDRRRFLSVVGEFALFGGAAQAIGCRSNKQTAKVLNDSDRDMVGSHTAGAETWERLIPESVGKLLARQSTDIQMVSHDGVPCRKRICFVGLTNESSEEIGDWGAQIYESIDTAVNESQVFEVINRRFVEAGLRECRIRPEDLFLPAKRDEFKMAMQRQEQPFDYLLYAKITSGTTRSNNKDYQRDYTLTLELIEMAGGHTDKEHSKIRKGYGKSKLGLYKHYG